MKKTRYWVQAAVIAAVYTVLTYLQGILIPGSTSMAIQFRASEAVTILALFTPAAIPGLTVGCFLSNLLNVGALPVDFIFGTFASFLTALLMYALRNVRFSRLRLPLAAATVPALINGLIVGLEIQIFFVKSGGILSYAIQFSCVALGELAVLVILGLPLCFYLEKSGLPSVLFKK